MEKRSVQAPAAVIMIRPHHFSPNQETAADNSFQQSGEGISADELASRAYSEATNVVDTLEGRGIKVHVFEDKGTETPDSVFPNNWFSTHSGGHVAIYPMFAENRRLERRTDVIEMLKENYRVQDIIDYSGLEPDGLFLEGTGAMVLDHIDRVAYVTKSNRADPVALERFCTHFNYEPMAFDAFDENGTPVYHTNVLMCVATDYVMISLEMMDDDDRRAEIIGRIESSGRAVIDLTRDQIANFAGNALELQSNDGRVLAISSRAHNVLTADQIAIIEGSTTILPLDIPTIELAGGSVRCMLAGIHLLPR
ncbi:MAG: arginine deiminase-related protein [Emcibacteraceae bacterium]|nr:arginine deiminase-related protein [Emcibacteraceae bacterium]MDG1859812.1 arginine deiminase-related protein [Emcibacteraceae bacterium]